MPKKHRIGPQNDSGSSGPEKMLKIVNCVIIKETEKNERNNGGVQVEYVDGEHRLGPQNGSRSSGPEKMLKIVNCAIIKKTEKSERNNGWGPSGIGGWPMSFTASK